MRIIRIAQTDRTYPRYIAEQRNGRLKGQYPSPEFGLVPSLKRQWDRGGFGTGTRLTEIEAGSPQELLDKIRAKGLNPAHDNLEFYEMRSPGSPRMRVPIQRLFNMARSHPTADTSGHHP